MPSGLLLKESKDLNFGSKCPFVLSWPIQYDTVTLPSYTILGTSSAPCIHIETHLLCEVACTGKPADAANKFKNVVVNLN